MVVLPLVATILLLPLTESLSLRGGCEEEFSSKEQTRNMTRGDQEDLLTFTLLHVNDIHSHFEEVNVNTGTCKVKLSSPPCLFCPSITQKHCTGVSPKLQTFALLWSVNVNMARLPLAQGDSGVMSL